MSKKEHNWGRWTDTILISAKGHKKLVTCTDKLIESRICSTPSNIFIFMAAYSCLQMGYSRERERERERERKRGRKKKKKKPGLE